MEPNLKPTFDGLFSDLCWLKVKWGEYEALFGTSKERIDRLNSAAGYFFGMIQQVMWEDSLLHLCRLTDPAGKGSRLRLTIRSLPDMCVGHAAHGEVVMRVGLALTAAGFARDWRNRRIAHTDLRLAAGHQGAEPLGPASRKDVISAISAIHNVLSCVAERVFAVTLAEEIEVPGERYSNALLRAMERELGR